MTSQIAFRFRENFLSGQRRSDHISDVIEQLGWLRADELAEYHTICAVQRVIPYKFPITSNIGPIAHELSDYRPNSPWNTWTLHMKRNDLIQLRARTETGRRRLCVKGVSLLNWANLDPHASALRRQANRAMLSRRYWHFVSMPFAMRSSM